jgi:hypothetical protein
MKKLLLGLALLAVSGVAAAATGLVDCCALSCCGICPLC